MKKLFLLITALTVLGASVASAQTGVGIHVTNCNNNLSAGSTQNVVVDCTQDPAVPSPSVILSFTLGAPLADYVGVQGAVEVVAAALGTVPEWWNAGSGSCREGLIAAVNLTPLTGCSNPYAGTPGQGGGLSFGPGSAPNRFAIEYAWARGGDIGNLVAGTRYSALRMNVSGDASGACAGCADPVNLEIKSMDIAGQVSGTTTVTSPAPLTRKYLFYQGGVGDPVPAANKTWGSLKALYR